MRLFSLWFAIRGGARINQAVKRNVSRFPEDFEDITICDILGAPWSQNAEIFKECDGLYAMRHALCAMRGSVRLTPYLPTAGRRFTVGIMFKVTNCDLIAEAEMRLKGERSESHYPDWSD